MLRIFDIGSTLNAVMICRQMVYVVLSFSLLVYGGKSRTDYSVPSLGLFFQARRSNWFSINSYYTYKFQ